MTTKEQFLSELSQDTKTPYKKFSTTFSEKEQVQHPSHYRGGTYEAINVIKAWDLNFCLGNALKYICRAGLKDPSTAVQDLEKAIFYLQDEIKTRKAENKD